MRTTYWAPHEASNNNGSGTAYQRKNGDGIRMSRIYVSVKSKISFILWPNSVSRVTAGTTVQVRTVIYSDNAGVPGELLTYSNTVTLNDTTPSTSGGSFSSNNKIWLMPGVYWVGIHQTDASNGGVNIFKLDSANSGTGRENSAAFSTTGTLATIGTSTAAGSSSSGAYNVRPYLVAAGFDANEQSDFGFMYAKQFSIDTTKVPNVFNTNMTNQRVLVYITDPDLRSISNGGKVVNLVERFGSISGNVYTRPDIEVRYDTEAIGGRIAQEIEKYDPVTGELKMYINVAGGTGFTNKFFLLYGHPAYNPNQTNDVLVTLGKNTMWSSTEYGGIYRLGLYTPDTGTGSQLTKEILDSSAAGTATGTTSGGMTGSNLVAGRNGKALQFDGVDDAINFTSNHGFSTAAAAEIGVLFYFDGTAQGGCLVKVGSAANGFGIGIGNTTWDDNGTKLIGLFEGVRWIVSTINITTGWHYAHMVIPSGGTSPQFYLDGITDSGSYGGTAFANPSAESYIGGYGGASRYYAGKIEEVRFTKRSRTANQRYTEAVNMLNNSTFFNAFGAANDDSKRYWVGGTGGWYENAHWSRTSGGAGGATYPDDETESWYFVDAIFDANSFPAAGALVDFGYGSCRSLNFTGVTNTPSFKSSIYVYGGDITLSPNANYAQVGYYDHYADPYRTVLFNPNGSTLVGQIIEFYYNFVRPISSFNATYGHKITGNVKTSDYISFESAKFDSDGYNIESTAYYFYGDAYATLDFKTSTLTVRSDGAVNATDTDFYNQTTTNNLLMENTTVVYHLEAPFASGQAYTWFNIYDNRVKKVEIFGDKEVHFFSDSGQTTLIDTLVLNPGAKANFDTTDSPSAAPIKIMQQLTAIGTVGARVTLIGADTPPTTPLSSLYHDAAAIFDVEYADITNLPLLPGTRDAGYNSVLTGTTTGWGGTQNIGVGTFDNIETVSPLADAERAATLATIAPTTLIGDINISHEPVIIPENIPAPIVGENVHVSYFNRVFDLPTIEPITVVTDVNIFNKTTRLTFETIIAQSMISPITVQGELAPNDTAPTYQLYAQSVRALRDIEAAILISFERQYDADASLFEVGVSGFDQGAVFRGNGTTIQEWDKFDYTDFTDKLLGFEYHFEQDVLGGMVLGIADINMANYGDMFSPYGASSLAPNILPNRPLRLYAGYKQNLQQIFVGQTMRLPDTNEQTAAFHARDFIASFADIELSNGRTYVNVTTDDIIDDLLQNEAGLSPTQYNLDVGENLIGFISFDPGVTIGYIIRELAQAELGRVYQEYDGGIHFKNRTNKVQNTAIEIRESYVYEEAEPDESNVINRVKIEADVRQVQAVQQVYPILKPGSLTQREDFQSFKVPANSTVEKFFNLSDPVTSYVHPSTGSNITANTAQDGSGANRLADLGFVVDTAFTESVKYRFTNTSGTDFYITSLRIDGTPAKVVEEIRVNYFDQASIDKYGEKSIELKNNAFTSKAFAEEIAEAIVNQQKDAPSVREITMKGLPYLNVGDRVKYYDGLYYIVDEISGTHSPSNGHTQKVRLRLTV